MDDSLTLINLFIATGARLDSLWQFFVTVNIALIAAMYGIERLNHLKTLEISLFAIAYLMFSLINVRGKQEAYELLISIEAEVDSNLTLKVYPQLTKYFSSLSYDDRIFILWVVHAFGILAISLILLKRREKS